MGEGHLLPTQGTYYLLPKNYMLKQNKACTRKRREKSKVGSLYLCYLSITLHHITELFWGGERGGKILLSPLYSPDSLSPSPSSSFPLLSAQNRTNRLVC